LFGVFDTFDEEIYKTITTSYSVRGGYEMTRESFDNYVKRKKEQINKIWICFEVAKKSSLEIIPKHK
jgi:hypothetical protein